jgi:tight adherence protein C
MDLADLVTNTGVMFGIGLVFVFIALGAMGGIFMLLNPSRSAKDRLEEMTGGPKEGANDPAMEAIAERIGKLAAPQDEEERNILKTRLIQAGYRSRNNVELFNSIRVVAAIGVPIVVSPLLATLSIMYLAFGVVIGAAAGYFVPMLVVNSRITARQKKLLHPFPDALDLLVTSVEAGLGVDAAFRRVATEIEPAAPELSAEFQYVNHEISAGVTRIEALKHLATRTGLDEVRSLVNMLAQSERFGTSIARSLRVHSEITRAKRMARAEEEAAKVSPKLTVAMILFLLPCLLVVILGPAMVRVKQIFMD